MRGRDSSSSTLVADLRRRGLLRQADRETINERLGTQQLEHKSHPAPRDLPTPTSTELEIIPSQPNHRESERYAHGPEGLSAIQDDEKETVITADPTRKSPKCVINVPSGIAHSSSHLEKARNSSSTTALAPNETTEETSLCKQVSSGDAVLSATPTSTADSEPSISVDSNHETLLALVAPSSEASRPAMQSTADSQSSTEYDSDSEHDVDPPLSLYQLNSFPERRSRRLKKSTKPSSVKSGLRTSPTPEVSSPTESTSSRADETRESSPTLPQTPREEFVPDNKLRTINNYPAAAPRSKRTAHVSNTLDTVLEYGSKSPGHTRNPDRWRHQLYPSPHSRTPAARTMHKPHMSNRRELQDDVRCLDEVEVVDGIELATQNVDGQPIPEFEVEKISTLSNPPERKQKRGPKSTLLKNADLTTRADWLRAATPPPLSHNSDQVRRIQLRAVNRGRSLVQSHFADDTSLPSTMAKEHIKSPLRVVKYEVRRKDEPLIEPATHGVTARSKTRDPGDDEATTTSNSESDDSNDTTSASSPDLGTDPRIGSSLKGSNSNSASQQTHKQHSGPGALKNVMKRLIPNN